MFSSISDNVPITYVVSGQMKILRKCIPTLEVLANGSIEVYLETIEKIIDFYSIKIGMKHGSLKCF